MNRCEVRSIAALTVLQHGMHFEALNAVIFDRLRECERRIRFTRSPAIQSHERLRRNSAVQLGSCAVVSLTRRSATRPLGRSRPGRTIGPSLDRPAALLGFIPSQVCSRGGWICISAHPGPHAFLIAPPDPIDFRRVDSPRPSCVSVREKAMANRGRVDVGFWASLPSAVRFATFSPGRTRARRYLNRDRSCLGLCLLQVFGHSFVHRRGLDPASNISLRMHLSTHPIRSCAWAILPGDWRFRRAAAEMITPLQRRDAQSHHNIACTSACWRG